MKNPKHIHKLPKPAPAPKKLTLSLEDKDGNALTLIDLIDDGTDIHEQVELSIRSGQLYGFLQKCLEERELQVIVYRYGLYGGSPHTQSETAKKLGISRSYVSRIEKKAIERLREMYESTPLH